MTVYGIKFDFILIKNIPVMFVIGLTRNYNTSHRYPLLKNSILQVGVV